MNDAIPICRSVFKHWIYDDAEFLKTWITMLGRAQYTPEPKNCLYMGISYTLHRGEFIFGRKKWCKDTGISEERLRRLITLMVKDNMISVVTFKGKFTIYKVVNYEKFNHVERHKTKGVKQDNPPTDTPTEAPTDPQQTPQQTTTNEEGTKKVKKDKKDIYGSFQNVFLTQQEYSKLSDEFTVTNEAIEFLSQYIEEKGYKSKSHYLAIRRWVIDAVAKKNGGSNERVLRSKHEQGSSTGHSSDGNSASKIPEGFWG